jgi:hypothetical protein
VDGEVEESECAIFRSQNNFSRVTTRQRFPLGRLRCHHGHEGNENYGEDALRLDENINKRSSVSGRLTIKRPQTVEGRMGRCNIKVILSSVEVKDSTLETEEERDRVLVIDSEETEEMLNSLW